MNKATASIILILSLLLPAFAGGTGAETQTLTGEYLWSPNERGKLKAVFTPAGARKWDVAFHFRWSGRSRVFSGTADGSLGEGPLEGEVRDEFERRTWVFRGEFEDGQFRGTHAEVSSRGRERETGALTLRR